MILNFFFTKFQGGAVAVVQHPTRRPWYVTFFFVIFSFGKNSLSLKMNIFKSFIRKYIDINDSKFTFMPYNKKLYLMKLTKLQQYLVLQKKIIKFSYYIF